MLKRKNVERVVNSEYEATTLLREGFEVVDKPEADAEKPTTLKKKKSNE